MDFKISSFLPAILLLPILFAHAQSTRPLCRRPAHAQSVNMGTPMIEVGTRHRKAIGNKNYN